MGEPNRSHDDFLKVELLFLADDSACVYLPCSIIGSPITALRSVLSDPPNPCSIKNGVAVLWVGDQKLLLLERRRQVERPKDKLNAEGTIHPIPPISSQHPKQPHHPPVARHTTHEPHRPPTTPPKITHSFSAV